jgi:hypothetical protein
MVELVHEYVDLIRAGETTYRARTYGEREDEGRWGGYLVFVPIGAGRVVGTGRETTQRTLDALLHWAHTLSWVYLEGALQRALELQPEVQLSRRLAEIEELEARALDEAAEFERAAEAARAEAAVAREEREIIERERTRVMERSADALTRR